MSPPAASSPDRPAPAPGTAGQGSALIDPGRQREARLGAETLREPAIVVEHLDKSFRLPLHRETTLKERIIHPFRRNPVESIQAARDVSFEIGQGEFFGIVGRNGSGKSTLLKLLAGIYQPDAGTIHTNGRLSAFIELGVGFNPDMAALDNVIINFALFGLSRKEAIRRFDGIIEFAGLERFRELKLKNYSSGMQVRLAFSTAIQVDADILLMDEVLAVGDAAFQAKCFDVFRRLRREGKTIILVSHDLGTISRLCDRAMYLEEGKVIEIGEPQRVVDLYRGEVLGEELEQDSAGEARWGDGAAQIVEVWFEDGEGSRVQRSRQGDQLTVAMEIAFRRDMEEPIFGIKLANEDGITMFDSNTLWRQIPTGDFKAGDRQRVYWRFENCFRAGNYFIEGAVAHGDAESFAEVRERVAKLTVSGDHLTHGYVILPHEIEVEPR